MSRIRFWPLGGLVFLAVLALGCGSDEPRIRNAELRIGDQAPDFRLPDHTGGYVKLSDYREKQNVVIAFYPLAWTPV